MAKMTRRGFIKDATAGAAAVGAIAVVPGMAAVHAAPKDWAAHASGAQVEGPLVAHVRNFKTGEVAVLVGTREVIIHDHALVSRLVRATE
jgi:hypothetical protein